MTQSTTTEPVMGIFHIGMPVQDLDRSLTFYRDWLGLEVTMSRTFTEPYLFEILGLPVGAMRAVYLKIPNSPVIVELLEYRGDARYPSGVPAFEKGLTHVCLYVADIERTHAFLKQRGVRSRSGRPVTITAGPNRGSKAAYMLDPDGYPVELLERRTEA